MKLSKKEIKKAKRELSKAKYYKNKKYVGFFQSILKGV